MPPMETKNLKSGRRTMSSSGRIITREEYDALMSELAQQDEPELLVPISHVHERVRRLEFNMMILVGLILVVFILSQHT
jgi:hypothetical protein